MPRTLEVELCEDLVDACVPGDVVTVGGVVKAIEAEVASGARGVGNKRVFLMCGGRAWGGALVSRHS